MNKSVAELFCEWVRIDSESGNEAEFIGVLKEFLEQDLGATCMLDGYGNLIAKLPAKNSDATDTVALAAHADTVKPGTGIEPVIENGVIRSAGATILGADDKAGIAEIVEAVRTADRHPPVEILITREEEIGLCGAKNLDLSLVNAKRAFIIDADDQSEVVIGGPTHVSFDITVIGRASHAGMEPEKGISAIRVAAMAIASMPEGRIDHETTANIGTIQGGLIRNGVPDRVELKAECRSLNDEKALKQAKKMRDAFTEAAAKAGAQVEIKEEIEYRASTLDPESEIVKLAAAAVRDAGLEPDIKVLTGGTDALVLANRGLEAVVIGFGGYNAHAIEEYLPVASLDKGAEILRHLLHRLADGS
ncbi:M20/M25/M40 family metallo-hydrolase [Candidatus Bipolaricaulota bacterium]|nr:M20/M25/M40 family metallo-hydrolase [Candidatus Bipolaricaulota bacterium]